MALKPIKRKYGFSDGTLAETGDSLVAFARRDSTEMEAFGYDSARLDLIDGKITTFKDFPPDEYYTGLMMEATANKNKAISKMSEVAEGIVQRASNKYGKDNFKVKGFGWTGYITKKDNDKVAVCRLVHLKGTELLTELSSEGLTSTILDDLKDKIKQSDENITKKAASVAERDAAVNERITIGNDVYVDLVKVADTGKHIFEDTNEAKYNDYVIYESQPGKQIVNGTVAVSSIHNPSVVVDSVADEIEIVITEGSVTVYFSDDPTAEPLPGQVTTVVDAATPFNGTAAELGWDA